MLSHPIESDGVSAQFFQMLSKENKKDMQSCRVRCPTTVLFEQGFAKAAFATEPSRPGEPCGELKRKPGKEIDLSELFMQLSRNSVDGDIVAVLLHASPRSSEMNHVRFLDQAGLRSFLFHEIEKPRSLLQRFIKPKGVSNTLIHAVWSPLLVLAEGRRNAHSLKDRHLAPDVRGTTFETAGANTTEVVVAQAVVKDITRVCKTVAEHFEKTEKLALSRLAAFFKVDENNRLQLLFSTSVRVQDSSTGRGGAPVSLAIAVKPPVRSSATDATLVGQQDDDTVLRETDKREGTFRISIPSMPDTAAMLMKTLHSSPSRGARSPSPSQQRSGVLSPSASSTHALRTPSRSLASPDGSLRQKKRPVSQTPQPVKSSSAVAQNSAARSRTRDASPSSQSPAAGAHRHGSPVVNRGEREVALTPGAALPQPRQLLRYQHLLPNSEQNLASAKKKSDVGQTEHEVRLEWETFLQQQQRQLDSIRRMEQDKADEAAIADATSNARGGNAGRAGDVAAPPVRGKAVFAGTRRIDRTDEDATSGEAGGQSKGTEHADDRRVRPAQQLDKDEFMQRWRAAHGDDKPQGQSRAGPARAEDDVMAGVDNVSHHRATVNIPVGAGKALRSVLLPPNFAVGSPKNAAARRRRAPERGNTPSAAGASPTTAKQRLSPITRRSPERSVKSPARASSRGKDRGTADSTSAPAATKTTTVPTNTTVSPAKRDAAAPRATVSVVSPTDGPQTPPLEPSAGDYGTSAVKTTGTTGAGGATMSPSKLAASLGMSPAELLLRRRAKAEARSSAEDDDAAAANTLSAVAQDAVAAAVAADCDALRDFVTELHYSLYCFFLRSTNEDAYIEVPSRLHNFVTPKVLNTLLHKLHGTVVKRNEYLRSVTPPGVALTQTRSNLLSRLHSGALMDFMPPEIENDDALTDEDASCIVMRRFDGRFTVLRGEDAGAADDEAVSRFCDAPDGVVYAASLSHHVRAAIQDVRPAADSAPQPPRSPALATPSSARGARTLDDDEL